MVTAVPRPPHEHQLQLRRQRQPKFQHHSTTGSSWILRMITWCSSRLAMIPPCSSHPRFTIGSCKWQSKTIAIKESSAPRLSLSASNWQSRSNAKKILTHNNNIIIVCINNNNKNNNLSSDGPFPTMARSSSCLLLPATYP